MQHDRISLSLHLIMKQYLLRKADMLGIGVGLICAIHCALLPVVLSSGVLSAISWADHVVMDVLFLIASLVIGLYALVKSYRMYNHSILPIVIASVGFVIIGYTILIHDHTQLVLPASGGILLAIAHYYNYSLRVKHSTQSK